jgi:AcrR family transcriptional regulator
MVSGVTERRSSVPGGDGRIFLPSSRGESGRWQLLPEANGIAGETLDKALVMDYHFHQSSQQASDSRPMNVLAKTKSDETRARILDTAETLFRRLGFAKTAVADIAAELGMSPANVYRFFPSKNAIVEAICQRCLGELQSKAWAVGRSHGPAAARLERLFLEILSYHKENLLTEQKVNDMVLVAIEDNWEAIRAHKEVIRTVIELILRDGIAAGEFEPVDPPVASRLLLRSMVRCCHPVLIQEALRDQEDLEAEARTALRFVLRAITPRT